MLSVMYLFIYTLIPQAFNDTLNRQDVQHIYQVLLVCIHRHFTSLLLMFAFIDISIKIPLLFNPREAWPYSKQFIAIVNYEWAK